MRVAALSVGSDCGAGDPCTTDVCDGFGTCHAPSKGLRVPVIELVDDMIAPG